MTPRRPRPRPRLSRWRRLGRWRWPTASWCRSRRRSRTSRRSSLSHGGHALERGGQGLDLDFHRGGAGAPAAAPCSWGTCPRCDGSHRWCCRQRTPLACRWTPPNRTLATGDLDGIVERLGWHVGLKAAVERGRLHLRVAHGQSVGVRWPRGGSCCSPPSCTRR